MRMSTTFSGVEEYVLADYRKPSQPAVNLYVGFYQSQKEGDIIHSPKNCLPVPDGHHRIGNRNGCF